MVHAQMRGTSRPPAARPRRPAALRLTVAVCNQAAFLAAVVSVTCQRERVPECPNGSALFVAKTGDEKWCQRRDETGSFVRHGFFESRHPDGSVKQRGAFADGEKDGRWTTFLEGGARIAEGSYERGTETGEWVYGHDNGNVSDKGAYVNGLRQGVWTRWNEQGQKIEEAEYEAGELNGRVVRWNSDGSPKGERYFCRGMPGSCAEIEEQLHPTGTALPPFAPDELKTAQEVVIDRGEARQIRLTAPRQIARLVDRMDFEPVPPCQCRIAYGVTFKLKDGREARLASFAHGWRFDTDTARQRRDDGAFIRELDRLMGKTENRR